MKHCINLILLILWTLLVFQCKKNPVEAFFYPSLSTANEAAIPDSIRNIYYEDAASLVLRNVLHERSASLELPAQKIKTIYSGLMHIYNATNLPGRDQIMTARHIHTAPLPHPHKIIVKFDSSAAWAKNWQKNISASSNARLSDLMKTYNISVPIYYFWGAEHAACLFTEKPLNTHVLALIFAKIPGIKDAYPVYKTSHSDITVTTGSYYWKYSFRNNEKTWNFFVYRDGHVSQ